MMIRISTDAALLLQRLAEHGELELGQGEFEELQSLGLVDVEPAGGGWGCTDKAILTDKGRRQLHMPALTQQSGTATGKRLRHLFGIRGR